MKIYDVRTLSVFLFVLAMVPAAFSQGVTSGSSSAPPPTDPCKSTIDKKCLKDLEPSREGTILRSLQYEFQLQEQPAYIVATSGSVTSTISNPDKWLQEHSIIFQPSELFPTGANLPNLIKAEYDSLYPDHKRGPAQPVILGPGLCGRHDTLQCLAGKGNFIGRLFSASSVTFSFSQRDKVQQGVEVPNLPVFQNWAWGYDITLKPASMFITGANWSSAVAVLDNRLLNPAPEDSHEAGCFIAKGKQNLEDCQKDFAKPRLDPAIPQGRLTALAAVLIPTFEMKALSQFDFIKQGGVISENPLLQRTLKNLTFTWDLRNLIPQTSDRVAIGTLYDATLKPKPDDSSITKPNDDAVGSKLCVIYSGTFRSYIGVPSDWTMTSCRGVAVGNGPISGYAVACAQERVIYIGTPADKDQYPGDGNKPTPNCGW